MKKMTGAPLGALDESMSTEAFDSIEACLEELRAGRFIVITDDAQRENEGDLVMAAECVTPEAVNFCMMQARGLLCAPCAGEILDRMGTVPEAPEPISSLIYQLCHRGCWISAIIDFISAILIPPDNNFSCI